MAALATTVAMARQRSPSPPGTPHPRRSTLASRAIEYLQAQQSAANGSIPVGASTDAVSEEYAIGAAAAGYDPKALRHGSGPR